MFIQHPTMSTERPAGNSSECIPESQRPLTVAVESLRMAELPCDEGGLLG